MSLYELKQLAIQNDLKAHIENNQVHVTGELFKMFVFQNLIIEQNIAVYQGSYSEGFHGSPVFKRFVPVK